MKPPARKYAWRKGAKVRKNLSQHEKDYRAEMAGVDRKLWGGLIEEVKLLRCRGYTVFRDGVRILLDYRPVSASQLVEKAAQVRRLAS